jgi:UDP-N-acetylglucosamine pyrophosphorylase
MWQRKRFLRLEEKKVIMDIILGFSHTMRKFLCAIFFIDLHKIILIYILLVAGIKLEKFVFDVFCFTDNFVVWECKREEEFSPLKNGDGAAKDTPLTARTDLFRLHKRYFENAGGKIIPKIPGEENGEQNDNEGNMVQCEISPLLSYAGENLIETAKNKVYTTNMLLIDVEGPPILE